MIAFTEKCDKGKTWVDDPPATFSVQLYSLGVSNAEVASELICMQVRVALNSAFDVCCLYWPSQREPWNESTNYNQWEKMETIDFPYINDTLYKHMNQKKEDVDCDTNKSIAT